MQLIKERPLAGLIWGNTGLIQAFLNRLECLVRF